MNSRTFVIIVAVLGVLLLLTGFVAMAVCAIFLFSSQTRDILGAGLGLIAGSVLTGFGESPENNR